MTHPLNEPFGNAEQLASLEQRARELLAGQFEKEGFPLTAEEIRSGIFDAGTFIRAIASALVAQGGDQ